MVILIATVVLHQLFDINDDTEKQFRFAQWISDHILWLIVWCLVMFCSWGALILVGLIWTYKPTEKEEKTFTNEERGKKNLIISALPNETLKMLSGIYKNVAEKKRKEAN